MRSGRLKHAVEIRSASETANEYGEPERNWAAAAVSNRQAAIEPLSGRELMAAKQINADVTHKVTIRYLAGLSPKSRVYYGDRAFEIVSVLTREEERRYQDLLCIERQAPAEGGI